MDNIKDLLLNNEYNEEPVIYCSHCLSLDIRGFSNIDYCNECGSTDMSMDNIKNWEQLYEDKYGVKYLERRNKNGREFKQRI